MRGKLITMLLITFILIFPPNAGSDALPVVSPCEIEELKFLISDGYNAYERGKPDSAHIIFEKAIQIDTSIAYGYYHNGCIYAREGKDSLAMDYLIRAIGKKFVFLTYNWIFREDPDWNRLRKTDLWKQVHYALLDKAGRLKKVSGSERKYALFEIARIYAVLGDTDSVFKYVALAIEDGFPRLEMFDVNPDFASFHCDSFRKFIRQKIDEKFRWTGSVEQKIWGLMLVHSEIKYNCVNLHLADFDNWDEEVAKYIPQVMNSRDKLEYYRTLDRLVSSINDNHTRIIYPPDVVENFGSVPLRLIGIKGKIYVREVFSKELSAMGVKPGMEVIEVDGLPIEKYLQDSVYPYLPHKPVQFMHWMAASMLFVGRKGTEVSFKLKDLHGKIVTIKTVRKGFVSWHGPLVEFRKLEDGIVYFNIRTFDDRRVLDEFFKYFNKLDLKKVKGMIIDVRENGGGNSGLGDMIISHLIREPVQNYVGNETPVYMPLISNTNPLKLSMKLKPAVIAPAKDRVYTGPLIILTSPGTGSAAEDFVRPLKESGRALVIGMPTGGGTGNPFFVNLPGGGKLRICINTEPFVGKGIKPDIEIYPAQEDLAKGRDPILQKAISTLKNQKINTK